MEQLQKVRFQLLDGLTRTTRVSDHGHKDVTLTLCSTCLLCSCEKAGCRNTSLLIARTLNRGRHGKTHSKVAWPHSRTTCLDSVITAIIHSHLFLFCPIPGGVIMHKEDNFLFYFLSEASETVLNLPAERGALAEPSFPGKNFVAM